MESGHAILSALVKALNHKLRTPLSVVSNELEIFRPHVAAEDYALAKKRLVEISELLSSVSDLCRPLAHALPASLTELVAGAARTAKVRLELCGPDSQVICDPALLQRALACLLSSCTGDCVHSGGAATLQCRLESPGRLVIRLTPSHPPSEASTSALGAYFNEMKGLENPIFPCIDSILHAHRARVLVQAKQRTGEVLLALEFPAAS